MTTHPPRQSAERRVHAILLAAMVVAGCVHRPAVEPPARRISYWEALAALHPNAAIAAAHTQSEKDFAEALRSLMAGQFENAERQFYQLRRTATDSIIRSGARVIYTATLQYQEKWDALAALQNEASQPKADRIDKASIELWALAFRNVPAKTIAFRGQSLLLPMSISLVGTPLVPVKIGGKDYNFWLDTGSSMTMLASDVARDLNMAPLMTDTLEIVTSTGRVRAHPSVIPLLQIGQLTVRNAPTMIVDESLMQMRETKPLDQMMSQVKIDGIIGFDIIRQLDLEVDYGEGTLRIRNPDTSRRELDRNMFWVGLPVVQLKSYDGVPLHFGLDTGAQQTFVTETLLDKLQLEPGRPESRRVGGLGGEISLRAPILPDVRLFVRGFPILFRSAVVRAPVYQVLASLDGVLGGDIWNAGVVRIDMTNGVFSVTRPRTD
ncbi:MAG TPA: retroviral-like aspartic protease family protein [Gemmatimonadaceae bacterium]|nr:retroviral-like aspartic protease family protein [Gemmatimonadaceae bacterium]